MFYRDGNLMGRHGSSKLTHGSLELGDGRPFLRHGSSFRGSEPL
ncbi:hypothetical protein [Flavobacterium phycosphaerae]|nr:hypothetical protein [Flavobacterium phycosphaerae]